MITEKCPLDVDRDGTYNTEKKELLHGEEVELLCESGVIKLKCILGEVEPDWICSHKGELYSFFKSICYKKNACNFKKMYFQKINTADISESTATLCRRPNDGHAFIAYRLSIINGTETRIEINPEQESFPNGTMLQYLCHKNMSKYEANALECVSGEWSTRLYSCCKQILSVSLIII